MSQAARTLPVDACLARLETVEGAKARIEARQIEFLARLWDNPPPVPAGGTRHLAAVQLAQMSSARGRRQAP